MDAPSIFLLVLAIIFALALISTHIIKMHVDYRYIKKKYGSTRKFYIYSVPISLVEMLMANFLIYYALRAYRGSHTMVCIILMFSILASAAFMLPTNDIRIERENKLAKMTEDGKKQEGEGK